MCLASQLVSIRPSILIMYIFFLISETVCRAKTDDQPPPQLQPLLLFKDTWHRWPCVRLWVSPQHNYVKKKKQAIRYTIFLTKVKALILKLLQMTFITFISSINCPRPELKRSIQGGGWALDSNISIDMFYPSIFRSLLYNTIFKQR